MPDPVLIYVTHHVPAIRIAHVTHLILANVFLDISDHNAKSLHAMPLVVLLMGSALLLI